MKQIKLALTDYMTTAQIDLEFHIAPSRISKNIVPIYFINGMHSLYKTWTQNATSNNTVVQDVLAEHESIPDAIINSDVQAARDAMTYIWNNPLFASPTSLIAKLDSRVTSMTLVRMR